jgi:molybdate transport system substrate-binding protein
MKRTFLFILSIAISLSACGPTLARNPASKPTIAARTLTVFAAASLNGAFTELGKSFETSHPGVKVAFNFAGSQTLSAQLLQGASADVFASANHTEMDRLVSNGLVASNVPKDFVTNRLVVILPPNNPAGLASLADLARPGLKLVLADVSVPAGKYARQVLDNLSKDASYSPDFSSKVLANVVSNETDVEVVVTKVQLGEADAGIVYISDSVAFPHLKTISIPDNYNVIAKYPIAVLAEDPQPDLAAEFVDTVLSPDGQAILKKWGFTPVAP